MSNEIKPPSLSEMRAYLAHYGVKGMRWGQVRGDKSGGGSVKVKGRPTYTQDEKRQAQKIVKGAKDFRKQVKKEHGVELGKKDVKSFDKEGFSVDRLAKLNTPARRLLNATLGTKYTTAATALMLAANAATFGTGIVLAPPAAFALGGAALLSTAHQSYKVYFQNLKNNPKIKAKIPLSADEMAKFELGRQFRKHVETEHGKVTLSSIRGTQRLDIFDKEGRLVGSKTREVTPPAKKKP